jgi:hypothetical protein
MKGPVIKAHRNLNTNPFRRRVKKVPVPDCIRQLVEKLEHSSRDEIILALKDTYPCLAEKIDTYNYKLRYLHNMNNKSKPICPKMLY